MSVLRDAQTIAERIESNPDYFFRVDLAGELQGVRARVATLVNASVEEVVLVPNATHGVNVVLHNFEWSEGDVVVGCKFTSLRLVHVRV